MRIILSIVGLVFLAGCATTWVQSDLPAPAIENPVAYPKHEFEIPVKNTDIRLDESAAFIRIETPSDARAVRFGSPPTVYSVNLLATVVDHVRVYTAIDWANGHEPHQVYYVLRLTPDQKLKYPYPEASVY